MKSINEITLVRIFLIFIIAVITLLMGISLAWNIRNELISARNFAQVEAESSYNKDILYRRWASMHGGVYVPVSEVTPPNPWLDVPNRDIETPAGLKLTLVNPAYMTRQVFTLARNYSGVTGHITSLNPIRPQNSADEWESGALRLFEKGVPEFSSMETMDGQRYLRYMKPMIVEENCMKCHAQQGYEVGDIRGGISVSVPMDTYLAIANSQIRYFIITYSLIYIIILVFSTFGYRRLAIEMGNRNQARTLMARTNEELNQSNHDLLISEENLTRALREKETLLRELYHRTKNTMQIICGMINLQANTYAGNVEIRKLVKDTEDRIQSISLVHKMLYQSQDLSQIPVSDYVKELSRGILQSFGLSSDRISFDIAVDDGNFLLDTAIPFGLVLNELITNSLKYAFPDDRQGLVAIRLERNGPDSIVLKYADNGIGFPPDFDFRNQTSMGFKLIYGIGETQMMGHVEMETGNGFRCTLEFRSDLYKVRV